MKVEGPGGIVGWIPAARVELLPGVTAASARAIVEQRGGVLGGLDPK